MVNTGVEANLVHDDDTCLLGGFVKGTHRRRDVAGGDNMSLSLDGCLDDRGMMCVRNEGNDEVMGGDSGFQRGSIANIQRYGSCTRKFSAQRLRGFEGTTG